jgi:hypothetical protein
MLLSIPKISLSTLFCYTYGVCSSLGVRPELPHRYKTGTVTIDLLHVLIILDRKREDKKFWSEE